MKHKIEFDEKCKSCNGTGIYKGFAELEKVGVVCHTCEGTGCHHVKIEYEDFEKKIQREGIKTVVEVNPGIGITSDINEFGGMLYVEWFNGRPFELGMENRKYTCPAWWYQSANYELKPDWAECIGCGSFSSCTFFNNKADCWKRFDIQHKELLQVIPK